MFLSLSHYLKDPTSWIHHTPEFVIIKDKYPKAKVHILALPFKNLDSIYDLSNDDIPLLRRMHAALCEFGNDLQIGFHRFPSMKPLHMHAVSTDFVSPCLKRKQHWNSFNTKLFLNSTEAIEELETKGKVEFMDIKHLEKQDLQCDGQQFKNMPALKEYLAARAK